MRLLPCTVTFIVLSILAGPVGAPAQQAGKLHRIGYLSPRPGIELTEEEFRKGLRELGYVESQNLVIEWRFAKGRIDLFPEFAAEMVRLKVDCIVTIGIDATRAARHATARIPIVMGTADDDPVRHGLISSLARPGGNVTGIINLGGELAAKRLQLLKEAVPQASRVAILWDPASGGSPGHVQGTQIAARTLGVQLQSLEIRSAGELDRAFEAAVKGRAEALIVVGTGLINSHRMRIIDLAAKTRLPAIYTYLGWVHEGGLMSYGTDPAAQYQRAASYVDRVLKGAEPGRLAVEQATKFLLVVNLRTAKALGLTMPLPLLGRADHVIE